MPALLVCGVVTATATFFRSAIRHPIHVCRHRASHQKFDPTGVFVALVAVTIIVFVLNGVVDLSERRLLRWRPPSDAKSQVST